MGQQLPGHVRFSPVGLMAVHSVDDSCRTLNKMVREAQLSQYNYILVVGATEKENRTVNIRSRTNEILGVKTLEETLAFFKDLTDRYL